MNQNKIKETLNYFYKLEFFSPYTPTGDNIYDSEKQQNEQISFAQKKTESEYNYIYYLGDFYYENAISQIRELTNDAYSETSSTAKSCILGFKLDEQKQYIAGTFSICRFIYAINKILREKKVDLSFDEEEISKIEKQIETKLITYTTFNQEKLSEIFEMVIENFPYIKEDCQEHIQIYKDKQKSREGIEEGPSILSSFYLEDLRKIKENPSLKIQKFLSLEKEKEIEIDKNVDELKKILSPKNYPLGKWPSIHHPSLMQQVSINLFTHGKLPTNVFSVNGPPGSGKSTLVKEIIASLIVERAIKMCAYSYPDDAFTKESITESNNRYYQYFYKLDPSLAHYSILVASNNNTAVENISLELPKADSVASKKTLTNLFNTDEIPEIYFTSLINHSKATDKNWGYISARLGKKENINEFLSTIWFGIDHIVPFKKFKEENPISFSTCKQQFLDKLQEVKTYQEFLESIEKDVFILEQLKKDLQEIENRRLEEQITFHAMEEEYTHLQLQIEKNTQTAEKYEELFLDAKKKLSWFQKIICLLFKNSSNSLKFKELNQKIEDKKDTIFQLKLQIIPLEEQLETQKEKMDSLTQKRKELEMKKDDLEQEIKEMKEKEGITIADSSFYENISLNKDSQEACPWTNKVYDTLREELFAYALQLQKAFILNSNSFYKNIHLLVNILNGNCEANIKKQVYKEALSTLFLFVPVISTSLASVQKFLGDIGEDELGFLIIDEAGQATPASVLGVINRFRKTILLGDPFQIEPVTTIPKELYRILDHEKKVCSIFHDSTLSAQIVADYQNCYGTKKEDVWIGCPLIIHRRCIEPMFSIANEIAYNKKMICSTIDNSEEENLSIKKSCWLDIGGNEFIKGNHFIQEQANKLLELVINAIKGNENKLPNLYIITPFKTVAQKTNKFLLKELNKLKLDYTSKEIENWLKDSCGTVHTFQGKEANEVILILGCDKKSKNAVSWASKTPNILNVAVSRAKYRITIIGDKDLWNVPYFNTAYSLLKKHNSNSFE